MYTLDIVNLSIFVSRLVTNGFRLPSPLHLNY